MNTKYRVLFGLPLIGLVVLFILHNALSTQARPIPRPQPSPTPEILENGWYRFTDFEAGYTVSYPPDAYLDTTQEAGLEYKQVRIRFPASVGDSNQSMLITVFSNKERLSLQEVVEQKVYRGKPAVTGNKLSLMPLTIAGLEAFKIETTPFFPGIFISNKNKIYFISLPMNMMNGEPPTPKSTQLFYKILDTFSLK